jgi:hypothetical protein
LDIGFSHGGRLLDRDCGRCCTEAADDVAFGCEFAPYSVLLVDCIGVIALDIDLDLGRESIVSVLELGRDELCVVRVACVGRGICVVAAFLDDGRE